MNVPFFLSAELKWLLGAQKKEKDPISSSWVERSSTAEGHISRRNPLIHILHTYPRMVEPSCTYMDMERRGEKVELSLSLSISLSLSLSSSAAAQNINSALIKF